MDILGKNINTFKALSDAYYKELEELDNVRNNDEFNAVNAKIFAIVAQMTCLSKAINDDLAEIDEINSNNVPEGTEEMLKVIESLIAELYPIAKPKTKK